MGLGCYTWQANIRAGVLDDKDTISINSHTHSHKISSYHPHTVAAVGLHETASATVLFAISQIFFLFARMSKLRQLLRA